MHHATVDITFRAFKYRTEKRTKSGSVSYARTPQTLFFHMPWMLCAAAGAEPQVHASHHTDHTGAMPLCPCEEC